MEKSGSERGIEICPTANGAEEVLCPMTADEAVRITNTNAKCRLFTTDHPELKTAQCDFGIVLVNRRRAEASRTYHPQV